MNTLQTDLKTVFDRLTQLATLEDFWQRFETIYGKEYNTNLVASLRAQWARGDFSQLPVIEVVSGEVLGQALWAYAASLNKIYLSEGFLATATLAQITAVILEEIGHFVDAQINATDTPGDEGEFFAALVLGRPLSDAEWQRIRQENDLCTVTIDRQEVALEQASLIKSGLFPTTSSYPEYLININDTVYFTADNGVNGRELWKSDGTVAGTTLIKDIYFGPGSSYLQNIILIDGLFYFTADDGVNGRELWKSDGTATGTVLIKDINSGPGSSYLQNITLIDGILYFTADDGVNGQELWKSDGTPNGTVLLKDIVPGPGGSNPGSLTNTNGNLYFTANDGVNGVELWKSDGTQEGTVLVQDVVPGLDGSYPGGLTNANGILYFISRTKLYWYWTSPHDSGYIRVFDGRLWKSDGTPEGTFLLKEFPVEQSSASYYRYYSSLTSQTNVNGTLYFTVNDGVNGYELWKSNGTPEGTVLFNDIWPGSASSSPSSLIIANDTLYFTADDGVNGRELWKSDGTPEGTFLIKDINSGSGSSYLQNLTLIDGILYFTADDGVNGRELWKSDGTPEETFLIKDINSGSGSSYLQNLTLVDGILYFTADDGVNGRELWKSDGTPEGTFLIKDINFGPDSSNIYYLINVNGTLYFTADDGVKGQELWKSDGVSEGTILARNINLALSQTQSFTEINSILYFFTNNGINGYELWKSDGTPEGTVLIKDIGPGSGSYKPESLTHVNDILYFTAYDVVNGTELWKSDGTPEGTVIVKDIILGSRSSNPDNLTHVNEQLFFTADNQFSGRELWKSDGTPEGTFLIKYIAPGFDLQPSYLTNVNNILYFNAIDFNGYELWKSDGTPEGTVLIKDIYSGPGSSYLQNLILIDDILYFTADDGVNGRELWKSDSTQEGTILVKDIHSGSYEYGVPFSSHPEYLIDVNGTLYFTAENGLNGRELWKSDGSPEGTVLIKDIYSSSDEYGVPFSSYPEYLININGTLYFTADDGVNGRELWKSDGTAAGTILIKDIYFGPGSSYLQNIILIDGLFYFTADDGVNGRELWKSDGTPEGTILVKDINPGSATSGLENLTNVNGTLYFTADDGINGRKIWTTDGTAAGTVIADRALLPSDLVSFHDRLFFTAVDPDGDGRGLQALNQAPTDISLNKLTIGKNLPTGSIVAFLSSTDPDGDKAFSYSLVAGAGDSDNSAFTINSNTLKLAVSPGDTTQSSFNIRVKTTDLGGLSYEEIFTLAVTDADEDGIIPSLSIQDAVIREGHSGQQDLTFTVRLSQPTSQAVLVDYSTADQTALALPDYDFIRDVLTIPAGQTEAQIHIPIRGDTSDEPSETFVVNLSNAIGATLLDSQAIGTIEQDDTPTTPLVFKGGMLQIAYVACYGRPGDPGGLAFWNKVFGDSKIIFGGGDELTGDEVGLFNTLTKAFGEGPEATQLFGSLTSVQKVNQVYNMAFNRDAEPEGLNFWAGHLEAGNITPANLGIYIALGAVDGDIITLRNKIASADSMSKAIDTPLETQAISTPAYADFGREWLAPLGDTSASLYAAETALTNSGLF